MPFFSNDVLNPKIPPFVNELVKGKKRQLGFYIHGFNLTILAGLFVRLFGKALGRLCGALPDGYTNQSHLGGVMPYVQVEYPALPDNRRDQKY
jgi:hypothetical protein